MRSDCYHPSPAVRASISGDGLVLLDVHDGQLFASNLVGARIWQLLEARRTRRDIAAQLASDYGIAVEIAERDVAAFVGDLVTRGLLRPEPSC
jgi:hypothetical protein